MRIVFTAGIVTVCLLAAGCDGAGEGAASSGGASGSTRAASGELTEQDVRTWVTQYEQTPMEDYRGFDEAASVVTISSVEIADGRTPTEQDKINGVRGDTLYPVQVRYTVQKRLPSGETETSDRAWSYDFYRDPFGKWSTVSHGAIQ